MPEQIEVFDLEGEFIKVEDRDKFYKEIKAEYSKNKKITKKVKTIRLLLLNSKGRIVIQRRNFTKEENPGLYDKTIGGHVQEGESYHITLVRECAEELGFPVSVLSSGEFDFASKHTDLNIVGIFKQLDYISQFDSVRFTKTGKKFVQPYMTTIYIGYYDGSIQFIDGESSGIQLYTVEELKKAIKANPNDYTEDLKFMITKYEKFLKPIK